MGGEHRPAGHDGVAADEEPDRGAGQHGAQRRGERAGDEEPDEVLDRLQPWSLVGVGVAGGQRVGMSQRGGAPGGGPLGLAARLREQPHRQSRLGGVGHRETEATPGGRDHPAGWPAP